MATCAFCKDKETFLYEEDVPICLECTKRPLKRKLPNSDQIRLALIGDIARATARVSEANQRFCEAIGQIPSGLPHPIGVPRIKNASNELTAARKEMMIAHKRLGDFMDRGIVPEDLEVKQAIA